MRREGLSAEAGGRKHALLFVQPEAAAIADRCALSQGFFKHIPTVGEVPHFGPSGAPPPGQNTDINVSLASQFHRPIGLDGADVCGRRIALVPFGSLFTGSPLRTLRSLRARLTLSARDALDPLRTLGTGRTLGPWVTFRPGVFAISGKRNRLLRVANLTLSLAALLWTATYGRFITIAVFRRLIPAAASDLRLSSSLYVQRRGTKGMGCSFVRFKREICQQKVSVIDAAIRGPEGGCRCHRDLVARRGKKPPSAHEP